MESIESTQPDDHWIRPTAKSEAMSSITSASSHHQSSHFRDIRSTSTVTTSTRSDSPGSSASSQGNSINSRFSTQSQSLSPTIDEFDPRSHAALLELSRNPPRPLPRCAVVNFRKEGNHLRWSSKAAYNTGGVAARVGNFEESFLLEEFSSRALPSVKKNNQVREHISYRHNSTNPRTNDVHDILDVHDVRIRSPGSSVGSKPSQEIPPNSLKYNRSLRSKQRNANIMDKVDVDPIPSNPPTTKSVSKRNILRQPFGQPEMENDSNHYTGRNRRFGNRPTNPHREQWFPSRWGIFSGGNGREGSMRRRAQNRSEKRDVDQPSSRYGFGFSHEPRSTRSKDHRRRSNELFAERDNSGPEPARYLSMRNVDHVPREGSVFSRFSKHRSKRPERYDHSGSMEDRGFDNMESVPVSRVASLGSYRMAEPSSVPIGRGMPRSLSQRRRGAGVNALVERSAEIERMTHNEVQEADEIDIFGSELRRHLEDRPREEKTTGRLSDAIRGREHFEKKGRVLSAFGMNKRKSRSDLGDDVNPDDPYLTFLTSEV